MTILVPRLSGSFEEAGVLSTAMSVCNIFAIISHFSVRNYQITDIDDKYEKGEYITFRIITCAFSLLVLPVYLAVMRYSAYITLSVLCYMLLKIGESMADVTQGIFQKIWRLDISCRSMAIRGGVNLAVFAFMEYLTRDLAVTLIATAGVSLVLVFFLDFVPCFGMFEININFRNRNILSLFLCCIPLFLHGILTTVIANIPRLAAQRLLGEEMLGFYSSVASPVMIVQMAAGTLFTPFIPLISEKYKSRDKGIYKFILGIYFMIAGLGVCAVFGFDRLGGIFLSKVFGEEIMGYIDLLLPAVAVSVLTSASWFVSVLFTVVERNITMVIIEGAAAFLVLVSSHLLINFFSLQGINLSLAAGYLLFIFCGMAVILRRIHTHFFS